jgi:hypothetical protein
MLTRSPESVSKPRHYKQGVRVYCRSCGSEIEIINPCTGASPGQVFRCCDQDMTPEVGHSSHLESET